MMNNIQIQVICAAFLVLVLVSAGCVAPPADTKSGSVDMYDPNQFQTSTTDSGPGSKFVTEATPFVTKATETMRYSSFATQTLPPEDMSCLIYVIPFDWQIYSNKTAFAFNLKNPPMYMNYTIKKPFMLKESRLVTDKSGNEKTVSVEYPPPYQHLDIIVRDRVTGDVLMQDGYGKNYGYPTNNTDIKYMKSGDLLIEVSGYNVSGAVGFWVKPSGNFENNESFENIECVHWVRSGSI